MNATSNYLNHAPRSQAEARLAILERRVLEEMSRNNAALSLCMQRCRQINNGE